MSPKFFDPQTLARIRSFRLRAGRLAEGLASGMHRSRRKGTSIEFAEHREYAPGDDLRYVDWKAYARTDRLFVKQYEDETNLFVWIALDASRSMAYRHPDSPLSKFEYGQCLAASLAWLALQKQDAVSATTFDSRVRMHVRPGSSGSHWNQIVDALDASPTDEKTSLAPALHDAAERMGRRGLVIAIGDFFDNLEATLAGLKQLRARRHRVAILHVLDAAELEFPFDVPTLFRDLELSGETQVDPVSLRAAYREEIDRFRRELSEAARHWGMEYYLMTTREPIDDALAQFLARHERLST